VFDLNGVALAAWTLAVFAIGALAGVVIRRTVPALAAAIAVWAGLALASDANLRRWAGRRGGAQWQRRAWPW
jgi:uncharacterized membrane protein